MNLIVTFFQNMTIDTLSKIVQISFYIVVGLTAVLTYISAKKGLLNTVNTEYQKKVINRLEEISKELGSEFNSKSTNYWPNFNPVKELVSNINKTFSNNKDYIEKIGEYPFGRIITTEEKRIMEILDEIESDPFIPCNIRQLTKSSLRNRIEALSEIYQEWSDFYIEKLLRGDRPFSTDGDDHDFDNFHNKIVDIKRERGCGISQIEKDIHEIRISIQKHFESFNPVN